MIPHQCLGAVWSRRDRDRSRLNKATTATSTPGSATGSGRSTGSSEASSVLATVEQFNAVSYRVISTILMGSDHIRSQQRARVISKWIDVAQVCCIEEFTQLIADIFFFKGIACSEKLLFLESHHLCITIQSYLSPQARLGSCSQRQGKLYHSSMTGVIDPILVVIIVCIVKSVSARLVFSLFYIESRFSISIFCQD